MVVVYTGDGKGKTSAAIGLLARALGAGQRVAFVQFIKASEVSEHRFFAQIAPLFSTCHPDPGLDPGEGSLAPNSGDSSAEFTPDSDPGLGMTGGFTFYKGGKGFFHAGKDSAENVSDAEHLAAARQTFDFALDAANSGNFDIVICDEINNAVADGLLAIEDLRKLISQRNQTTSLCLTGRNWPTELNRHADIITEMKKVKHHYDDGFLAEKGIDF